MKPQKFYSYIHQAVEAGDIGAVGQFLEEGVYVNELDGRGAPPLQVAAARGHLAIAQLLADKGGDVNYLIEQGGTPLMAAAANLRPKLIKFLISKGAQPNKKGVDGRSPLSCAFQPAVIAVDQQLECIELLIDAGANIDERTDTSGTPLMKAAWFGNSEAVKKLLELGANPNLEDSRSRTAAMMAFERGHDELANLLKQAAREWREG